MGVAAIPFNVGQQSSVSPLAGGAPLCSNVIIDAGGSIRRRPGISAWSVFPSSLATGSAVIGMTYWREYLVWVTADRRIHAITPGGSVTELSDPTDSWTMLAGGNRPSFVRGRDMLVIAGGGDIQKWRGGGLSERLQGISPVYPPIAPIQPPSAVHICGISQRLIALRPGLNEQIWWSAPIEDYENWDPVYGASSQQAMARPDPIVAMADNTNELFAFGTETLQVFIPSTFEIEGEIVDFSSNRTMNIGTLARDSIVPVDDMFAMFDRMRRVILTDGRTLKVFSDDIATELANLAVVEDCWGFRLRYGRWDAVVYMFPTAGKGFIYDLKGGKWAEWREWNIGPTPVSITAALRWEEQDLFLVGMADGTIARIDPQAQSDLGKELRVEVVTPFVAHEGAVQKHCKAVVAQFAKSPTASGRVRISLRDDMGAWHVQEDVEIGEDMDPSVIMRSLGVYRQRQWKIEYTGSNDFVLASMTEHYDALGA
jgi:hypothetical protein